MMDARLVDYLATFGIDPGDAELALKGWTITEAFRNGECVGLTLVRGTEIHIVPFIERKALTRKNIHAFLKPILDEWGFVTTKVPLSVTDHKLRTTLGFKPTWSDDQFQYFALTELPFMKQEASCQSQQS